jgi:hypothetical protein
LSTIKSGKQKIELKKSGGVCGVLVILMDQNFTYTHLRTYWGKFFTKTQNKEKSIILSESSPKELQNEL